MAVVSNNKGSGWMLVPVVAALLLGLWLMKVASAAVTVWLVD